MERGNMVQGAEWKHILLFSLPLMAGNALQQLYNTVDSIVVGNFIGDKALVSVRAPMDEPLDGPIETMDEEVL